MPSLVGASCERGLDMILSARPKQIGVLLNKIDFNRNRYYYSP